MTNATNTHKCLLCNKPCQVTTIKRGSRTTIRSLCCLTPNIVQLVK